MMKMKKASLLLLGGTLLIMATGCSKSDKVAKEDKEAETAAAKSDTVLTGYLVDHISDYVTLGEYTGLDVEKPIYAVSDEDVSSQIEFDMYNYSSVEEVDRPVDGSDVLTISIKAIADGSDSPSIEEEEYTYEMGYDEFGEDFESNLNGLGKNTPITFTCSFDEDSWFDSDTYPEWENNNVTFTVTVKSVYEYVVPECTDEFVQETLGFDTLAEYEASIRESLEKGNEEQSLTEAQDNALNAALENATFKGYPDDLYDTAKADMEQEYAYYAEMYGMSLEEIYDAFEMSEEDMEESIIQSINQKLLVSAICEAENLNITTDEFDSVVSDLCAEYGYENPSDFENDYGKEAIVWYIYYNKASTFLLDHANIDEVAVSTDIPEDFDEEDYEMVDIDDEDFDGTIEISDDEDVVDLDMDVFEEETE